MRNRQEVVDIGNETSRQDEHELGMGRCGKMGRIMVDVENREKMDIRMMDVKQRQGSSLTC